MGPMDKEGKKIWVLCSAACAVENEIARASKQPSPGRSVLGSVREFSNLLGGFGETNARGKSAQWPTCYGFVSGS